MHQTDICIKFAWNQVMQISVFHCISSKDVEETHAHPFVSTHYSRMAEEEWMVHPAFEMDGGNESLSIAAAAAYNVTVEEEDTWAQQQQEEEDSMRLKTVCIFWFEGVLVPVAGSAGLLGNVLSVMVLQSKDLDLTASFVNLLTTLCVFDSLFIVCVNLFYTLPIHSELYETELIPYLTPVLLPLVHIVLTGSVYTVVAVAVERYWIICGGGGGGGQQQQTGKRFVLAIVVFSSVYNINKFFEVSVEYATVEREVWNETYSAHHWVNVSQAQVAITSLRADPDYLKAIIIANFVVMVIVPLVILSACHVLTYRKIRENTRRHNAISSHQRRDDAMAMLFFIIIFFFVLCHSGKFVLNFYEISQVFYDEEDKRWPLWAFLLTRVNHFLLVINSSVNFFIYCFRDAKFRDTLIKLLGLKRCWESSPVTAATAAATARIGSSLGSATDTTRAETIELVSKASSKRQNGDKRNTSMV